MPDKIQLLANILLDPHASAFEKDDAAMDLGSCGDEDALKALIFIASNPDEEFIADVAGESIASIWIKLNVFNLDDYQKLIPVAKREAFAVIQNFKPQWIEIYNLTN